VKGARDFRDGKRKDVPGVVIIDDNTVKLVFEGPNSFFLDNLNTLCALAPAPVLPAHVLEKIPPDKLFEHELWLKGLLGSGPWKFVQWVPDQFMEMEAFDDFYFGRPKIDRIVMAVIPSNDATEIAMQRGEVDVNVRGGLSVDAQRGFLADPRFDVYATQGAGTGGFSFNMRIPVINDPRLHQAIAYALDRQLMFQTFAQGLGKVVLTPLTHAWYQKPEWDKLYPYDPDKARALLKEMKWDSNRKIKVMTSGTLSAQTQAYYTAVQQYLKDVGVLLEFDTVEPAVNFQRYYVDHNWEMTFGGGGGVQGGPAQWLGGRWVTCSAVDCDAQGYAAYHFPVWDQLVEKGQRITDRVEAAKFWQGINEDYWLKDLPILATWISADVRAKNKRFVIPELGAIPKPGKLNQIRVYPIHIGRDDWYQYHMEQWDIVQ
jgi:ABC-type transport system substrate-binding protein